MKLTSTVKLTLWALLTLAFIVAVGYFGVGLFIANQLSTPIRQPEEHNPADLGLDYREVSLKSTDGLTLAGWWIPSKDSSRAVVLVPGAGGNKSGVHLLQTAALYAREGYAVLMLDLRGQGGSEGDRITMGYQEVRDVRGALSWLEEQGFESEEVVLHGWSMGGATVLRSAPGKGVAAVVEEAGYADLPPILADPLLSSSGFPSFFNPGAFLMAKLFLDYDPWAVRPEEDAAKLSEEGVPLLIIHSRDDEVVPFEHAERLKAAYPEASYWVLQGYRHVGAYAHPEYPRKLFDFLEKEVFAEET